MGEQLGTPGTAAELPEAAEGTLALSGHLSISIRVHTCVHWHMFLRGPGGVRVYVTAPMYVWCICEYVCALIWSVMCACMRGSVCTRPCVRVHLCALMAPSTCICSLNACAF